MAKVIRITRKDLLEQVWSVPMIHLAPKYGLSDVGLRKRCKSLKIPLPPQGYWQGKRYEWGTPSSLPPYDGPEEIEFTVNDNPLQDYPVDLEQIKQAEEQISFEQLEENKIKVIPTLRSSHPLITLYRKTRGNRSPQLNDYSFDRTNSEKRLDISVSKGSLRRALCIMNTLLKELEKRGFPVSVEPYKHSPQSSQHTFVEVFGIKLQFGIKEPYRQIKRERPLKERQKWPWLSKFESELVPSGNLVLEIKEWKAQRKNWSDKSSRKLEDSLNEFIIGLVKAAIILRSHHLREEEERRRREAEMKRHEELKKQKAKERKKLNQLLKNANSWDQSQKIRFYIEAVKKTALKKNDTFDPESDEAKWIAWAEQQADRLDPLVDSPPSILNDEKEDDFSWRYCDFD